MKGDGYGDVGDEGVEVSRKGLKKGCDRMCFVEGIEKRV